MALTIEQLEKIKYLLTEDSRAISGIDKSIAKNQFLTTQLRKEMVLAKTILVQSANENVDLVDAIDKHIVELKENWQTYVIEMLPEDCYIDNELSCLTIIHEASGLSLNIIEHNPQDFSLVAEINEIEVADNLLDPSDSISSNLETVLQYVKKFFPKE
jgi:hypothetical protein